MSDNEPTSLPCRHAHVPDHMKGWEAFGISQPDSEPLVRRLGYGHHTAKPTYGTEPWGRDGAHKGVSSIEVHSYHTGAFIYVCGPDRDAVAAAYVRTRTAITAAQAEIWPTTKGRASDG